MGKRQLDLKSGSHNIRRTESGPRPHEKSGRKGVRPTAEQSDELNKSFTASEIGEADRAV